MVRDLSSRPSKILRNPGDLVPNEVVAGRYRVVRNIGGGAYGDVYEVQHIALQKAFALKLLNAQASTNWRQISRFQQEAIAASKINHPNIVSITDVGQTDAGRAFYVMELLHGETLATLIAREGTLTLSRVIPILAATCHALHAAHEAGVVHRDLKPDNVFLVAEEDVQSGVRREVVRVLDFGLAKVLEAPGLTVEGIAYGTPGYMAPEQIKGETADRRADVYSIGCIAFEMFAGRQPFMGTPISVALAHCEQPVPDLRRYDGGRTPARLRMLIERCLSKEPEQRFATCAQLLGALREMAVGLLTPDGHSREMPLPPDVADEIQRARKALQTEDAGWWDDFGTVTGKFGLSGGIEELGGPSDGLSPSATLVDAAAPDFAVGSADQEVPSDRVIAVGEAAGELEAAAYVPAHDPAGDARVLAALSTEGFDPGNIPGFVPHETTIQVSHRLPGPRKQRRGVPPLVLLWMGLLTLGVVMFLGFYHLRSSRQPATGVLVVNVDPPGLVLTVNGLTAAATGKVRVINDVKVGEVELIAEHDGCEKAERLLKVEPGRATMVEINLGCSAAE